MIKPKYYPIVKITKYFVMKLLNKIAIVFFLTFLGNNMVSAQSTRKERKAARAAEIKSIVDARNYVFKANYVNPARGASTALTSNYDMVVSKDTIIAFLPYFGRAYLAPYNPAEGGIKFTNTHFTYSSKTNKGGNWTITIRPTNKNIADWRDIQSMIFNISTDGYASLQVISSNRDAISFNGTIEKREK